MRWRRRLQRRQRRAAFEARLRIVTANLMNVVGGFDAAFVRATAPLRSIFPSYGDPPKLFSLPENYGAARNAAREYLLRKASRAR